VPVNADTEYFNRISHNTPLLQRQQDGRVSKTEAQTIRNALALASQDNQYARDVAFWYGMLASPQATPWKKGLVRNIFSLLHFGGLMYKFLGYTPGVGVWTEWHGTGWPIAVALSHSARVTVQLEQGAAGRALWTWLWTGGVDPTRRSKATHGLDPLATAEKVWESKMASGPPRYKRFLETKKDNLVQHGVNIGLGGVGQRNPHSGNTIRENGEHGHLYIGYRQPTDNAYGALLIGCEPSAPADMWEGHATSGPGMWANAAFVGVPDQQGAGHTLGVGQDYSATGGMRWDRGIFANDPNRPEYYNGMLVDLSENGDCARFVNGTHVFTDDLLGSDGLSVPDHGRLAEMLERMPGARF
jgi:hypothetical protein